MHVGISATTKGFCKVLLGAMMLGIECLPKGGTLFIDPGETENTTIIRAEGTDAVVRDNVENALKSEISPDDLDPRLVHPYALGLIAKSYGLCISIIENESDHITIQIQVNL